MTVDLTTMSIANLAKYGHYEELRRRAANAQRLDLAEIFDRAVADFRTVRRNGGHQKILQWCLEQGLDPAARAGWLNEPVACLAAAAGNNEIVASMIDRGLPACPFIRAAVGDVEFLQRCAAGRNLAKLHDENDFNLLFYCAQSGLGRSDEGIKKRLTDVCRLLLDCGVSPSHEVKIVLPISAAFLCAYGGNEQTMQLLLAHGGLSPHRFHLTLEHALEPHQRSGEPHYEIASLILQHGDFINARRPDQGRTLLHASANRGAIKAVNWLLQHGADPNTVDDSGRTPLHVCAERNRTATVIKLLVEAGANVLANDSAGKTALDYARERGREKVVAYLLSVGGS